MEVQSGTYIISGITGFLGGLIAKELMNAPEYLQGNIKLIGIARDRRKAQNLFCDIDSSYFYIVDADILDLNACKKKIQDIVDNADFLIHCAAATTSAYMVSNPVETADGIVIGTRNMLDIARELHVKSMVYLSSMEVYGKVNDIGRARTESELGEIALNSVRSCYSLGKRMAEHYCYDYYQEYGVPIKVARLAQIFGFGVQKNDSRVYMQFARAAYEGRDIVLKTQGISMGNYCSSKDAVKAIFIILYTGQNGETYNVVNEANTMRIREMAELVANQVANGKIKVRVEQQDLKETGYAPDTDLKLSGKKMEQLGWKPSMSLVEMYREVIEELKSYNKR